MTSLNEDLFLLSTAVQDVYVLTMDKFVGIRDMLYQDDGEMFVLPMFNLSVQRRLK